MIPGMNPRDLAKAMKKMGIKQDEIIAEEVIIKCPDKDIIVKNPQVMRVNAMGQESLQITGEIIEQEAGSEISEEDIKTVAEQASVSEDKAKEALEENSGDLAQAILSLQE
ncbi:nascent polypeptide-associated complex protein [Candidatus Woesearchaeota archaeon]|jgi:nascent polypeptide-associated complex subunit alpha|nr:nascent polypeptide-associated complex protein [archaeon]MBT3438982.1 nascent polypeptide-associated complex protein [Candidatus Woesearchaeota archaeon]MBT4058238.1 nascent polypeptide-associated complex protein [Candidatus Woesearchaeota archaeon]MBT4208313.1 nascent polypeptide-associated complex protein [Candidatus Woesearchaeota archaeon]MBT4730846.1 nascent polypeptide-associated complex protein [Candidatus Woesearchaeota archaeon]